MNQEPFFTRDGDRFIPQPPCRGVWDPKSLSGRVVVALLGFQIEELHGSPDFMPSRLTVDMYRLPGFAPIEVKTTMVRDGNRIKVIDAEFISEGVSCARATSQWLKRSENPEGTVWSPPNWNVPDPDDIEPPANRMGSAWTTRPIPGQIGEFGQKRSWMKEIRELVGGTPLSPLMRAACAADLANPFSNGGDAGLRFINSDVTLYLHRFPVDEWVGLEVVNHQATDGVSIGSCVMYDRKGAIGTSSVTGPAQRRTAGMMPRPPENAQELTT